MSVSLLCSSDQIRVDKLLIGARSNIWNAEPIMSSGDHWVFAKIEMGPRNADENSTRCLEYAAATPFSVIFWCCGWLRIVEDGKQWRPSQVLWSGDLTRCEKRLFWRRLSTHRRRESDRCARWGQRALEGEKTRHSAGGSGRTAADDQRRSERGTTGDEGILPFYGRSFSIRQQQSQRRIKERPTSHRYRRPAPSSRPSTVDPSSSEYSAQRRLFWPPKPYRRQSRASVFPPVAPEQAPSPRRLWRAFESRLPL